jgi:hypothetical protein
METTGYGPMIEGSAPDTRAAIVHAPHGSKEDCNAYFGRNEPYLTITHPASARRRERTAVSWGAVRVPAPPRTL